MDGTLAQIIAITSYGNEYLKTGATPGFYPDNSTFNYCKTVVFKENKRAFFLLQPKEVTVAENPVAWFRQLKADKCKGIKLHYVQQQGWIMETKFTGVTEYWTATWNAAQNETTDNRIWSVTYEKVMVRLSNAPVFDSTHVIAQHKRLGSILAEITAFAFQNGLASWGNYFEQALKTLHSENPEANYYKDMLAEKSYPLAARQLLFAATSSNAFGGQGSWNDVGLDSEEYKKLSWDLFNCIYLSIQIVLNGQNLLTK